jgi:hypothetical protein
MNRPLPRKAATLLFIFLYAAALILNTSCFGERGALRHSHHQPPAADHPSGCLLACATTVAEKNPQPLLLSFILFLGIHLFYALVFQSQRAAWNMKDRAPPLPQRSNRLDSYPAV